MYSFFAIQKQLIHSNGWRNTLSWARAQIKTDNSPIKLLRSRSGEPYATVIAEVTESGERLIQGGRLISIKKLRHG